MPKKIDWSQNENNVRLLAATYAVLGKDTFSGCFGEIARLFGEGATYDSINHRYRAIADRAEQLHEGVDYFPRPTITRRVKPLPPRKRPRYEHTATLEPDDLLVIEQGRERTPAMPLRNASSRRQRTAVLSPSPGLSASAGVEDIAHGSEIQKDDTTHVSMQSSVMGPGVPLSVEPVYFSFEADTAAEADETLEARMARSSQEHAEQRAQNRRMYMDVPSNNKANDTPTPYQQLSGYPGEACSVNTTSYIDPAKKECFLCRLRWDDLKKAQQHEAVSDLHRLNFLQPEIRRAADRKLAQKKNLEQSSFHTRNCMPGKTTGVVDSLWEPTFDVSAPEIPTSDLMGSSSRTRESSVIIIEPPPCLDKGKARATPTPTPIRHHNFSKKMRWFSARGRRSLPKFKETFDVMDDLARELDRGYSRESSSSILIESACDDSQDEDYMGS